MGESTAEAGSPVWLEPTQKPFSYLSHSKTKDAVAQQQKPQLPAWMDSSCLTLPLGGGQGWGEEQSDLQLPYLPECTCTKLPDIQPIPKSTRLGWRVQSLLHSH